MLSGGKPPFPTCEFSPLDRLRVDGKDSAAEQSRVDRVTFQRAARRRSIRWLRCAMSETPGLKGKEEGVKNEAV